MVGRVATELGDVMTGPEEHWVQPAAEAYRRQDAALLAHTASFLTRAHDALRVAWRLEGADAASGAAIGALAPAGHALDRAGLTALAQQLARLDVHGAATSAPPAPIARFLGPAHAQPEAGRARLARVGRQLGQLLPGLPDGSLAADWAALCQAIARDARQDPRQALGALRRVLAAVAHAGSARVWLVGSSHTQAAVQADLDALLATLDPSAPPGVTYVPRARVTDRARARGAHVFDPRLAALVNPSTASASVVDSAPTAGLDETRDEALVDFLALNVFSGTGAHNFYKRIWGAALAYSGYLAVSPTAARATFYSDRCADLPQLLRFVEGDVRAAPADPRFVDYAVANTFYARTAEAFESRAWAMATDLLEGRTPDRVRAMRARLIALRGRPGFADAIHGRLTAVYGTLVPSLAPADPIAPGAQWFAVGPERQLAAYERDLRASRGPDVSILRLYPRDFWDVRDGP